MTLKSLLLELTDIIIRIRLNVLFAFIVHVVNQMVFLLLFRLILLLGFFSLFVLLIVFRVFHLGSVVSSSQYPQFNSVFEGTGSEQFNVWQIYEAGGEAHKKPRGVFANEVEVVILVLLLFGVVTLFVESVLVLTDFINVPGKNTAICTSRHQEALSRNVTQAFLG